MGEVRVALVGVGNCANSLIQGIQFYRNADIAEAGLVRPKIGKYAVADIKIVTAFDVTESKVGADITKAIWAFPNDTHKFAQVPLSDVTVQRGPTFDGLGKYLSEWVQESMMPPVDVAATLRAAGVDVVVNYLPVGSQLATEFYADAALQAGAAFVNCMPAFIASNPTWEGRFAAARLPIIGDDVKSQVGATIVHRALAALFRDRGVRLDRTYQLNVGGNGDFRSMLERERLVSKKQSKTEAVVSVSGVNFEDKDIHVGPSDYVQWLGDKKICYIRMEGTAFGGVPLELDLKLAVWDSPNSAGVVLDAIRCAKLAMDRRLAGAVLEPSAYFMKRPPKQVNDGQALEDLEAWLQPMPVAAE